MHIAIFAAMSQNRVIGRDGALPWDVPDGFCCFLRCIDGQTVIAGRKGWEAIGKHFTSSHNIVVTSAPEIAGAEVAPSVEAAIEQAKCHDRRNVAEYEGHLEIEERLLEDLIACAEKVYATVTELGPVQNNPP